MIINESDDFRRELEKYYQPIGEPENNFPPILFFYEVIVHGYRFFVILPAVFEVIGDSEQ